MESRSTIRVEMHSGRSVTMLIPSSKEFGETLRELQEALEALPEVRKLSLCQAMVTMSSDTIKDVYAQNLTETYLHTRVEDTNTADPAAAE